MAQIRMEDFLSPTSNLTPGAVGALAVGISLPVAKSFGLSIPLILLVVSLLFAYLIITKMDSTVPIPTKIVFFILNALVIFSVSVSYGKFMDPPPQNAQTLPMRILIKLGCCNLILRRLPMRAQQYPHLLRHLRVPVRIKSKTITNAGISLVLMFLRQKLSSY